MYPAHITEINGERREQSVYEHCRNTADYTAQALKPIGLYCCGFFVGLIHDIGKLSHLFCEYIRRVFEGVTDEKGTVNHSFAAVIFILENYHTDQNSDFEKLTAEILAWATASHHGIVDLFDLDGKSGFLHRLQKDRTEICYDEVMAAFGTEFPEKRELDELFAKAAEEITHFFKTLQTDCGQLNFCAEKSEREHTAKYMCGMLARMIASALIDGDRRDTAEFMRGEKYKFIIADKALWGRQLEHFEGKISGFKADTPINKARAYISDSARDFARNEGGIYRITVPTGAGKTLATLRFALTHAEEHSKSRIIFVIPLLSVLDQNSDVIRDYIRDKDIITEHHSNVVKSEDSEQLDKYELLAQTWETPVLITTLVQLLNTLFSSKTTAVRRMKSLCNSVIVIDEVQSLPHKLLYMFNEAINFLAFYCGATIVLSSATQPCFEAMAYFLALSRQCEIAPFDEKLFSAFRRTEIIDKCTPYGMSLDELADFSTEILEESKNLLIICNTRRTARDLYKYIKTRCRCKVFHLSNNMCAQHRTDTLKSINKSLELHEKMICVSTQLVEAGVDFSFESCIRVKAGIDNIAQAAGRCNRSNDYGHICKVYVVSLKDEKLSHLKEIRQAQDCTAQILYSFSADKERFGNDLLSAESVSEYYRCLFGTFINKETFAYPVKDIGTLFELLSCNRNYSERGNAQTHYKLTQAFKTAGRLFEVFDSEMTDVIVPYNTEADEIINNLCSAKAKFDLSYLYSQIERAKPYTIHLFADKNKDYMLYSDEKGHFTALQKEFYNSETGLDENNIM